MRKLVPSTDPWCFQGGDKLGAATYLENIPRGPKQAKGTTLRSETVSLQLPKLAANGPVVGDHILRELRYTDKMNVVIFRSTYEFLISSQFFLEKNPKKTHDRYWTSTLLGAASVNAPPMPRNSWWGLWTERWHQKWNIIVVSRNESN